jgi:hypothetical protein
VQLGKRQLAEHVLPDTRLTPTAGHVVIDDHVLAFDLAHHIGDLHPSAAPGSALWRRGNVLSVHSTRDLDQQHVLEALCGLGPTHVQR